MGWRDERLAVEVLTGHKRETRIKFGQRCVSSSAAALLSNLRWSSALELLPDPFCVEAVNWAVFARFRTSKCVICGCRPCRVTDNRQPLEARPRRGSGPLSRQAVQVTGSSPKLIRCLDHRQNLVPQVKGLSVTRRIWPPRSMCCLVTESSPLGQNLDSQSRPGYRQSPVP